MPDDLPAAFLWGMGPPVPEPAGFTPRSSAWWNQYQAGLSLEREAIRELAKSSRELAALLPDPQNWGDRPTPIRGLIVGAIQSGKTASMMGLAAVALDQGFRIVIVLAGDKDDLRRQTARRFNTQLLRQSDRLPDSNGMTTLGRPQGSGPLGGFAPPFSLDANQYSVLQLRMQAALRGGDPCVLVLKKNISSLNVARGALDFLYSVFGARALPTLVLDDECDEASVDAAGAAIPIAIANLWRRSGEHPLVAYLGYTATAAANILQHPENELYPAHFAYLLRYPGESDTAIQYRAVNPDSWYSGGECFYEAFGDEPGAENNFLVAASIEAADLAVPVAANPSLLDALRAYFVSGAYRLALDPTRGFAPGQASPRPHSMLVQTSASTEDHVLWLRGIQELLSGRGQPDKTVRPGGEALNQDIQADEAPWRAWYDRFAVSRERIYLERPHASVQRAVSWAQVKQLLPEVFDNTKVKVVNSDEAIGTSLDFNPRMTESGELLPPQDQYVIVVGGAKLSRGLTVEGLCISYFTRWTPNPTEDTVLQLSRWFGYRGSYLEFCRVFCSLGVYQELRQMSDNDVALRYQLAALMSEGKPLGDAILVIRANSRAFPTGKMGDAIITEITFSPCAALLPCVECGSLSESNEQAALRMMRAIRGRNVEEVRTLGGVKRGFLSRGWSAAEIADILDVFEYTSHNPDCARTPLPSFYRQPSTTRGISTLLPASSDPYQIAAYLRAWAAGEQRPRLPAPVFNVGVAYGEIRSDCQPFDFPLLNRLITHNDRVLGGFTGRSANWPGDAFFDQPPAHLRITGSLQRREGADGLLLFYVLHKNGRGRSGRGKIRQYHTPALAVSIPAGGPAYRRVVVAPAS
jgi:hypothetical protein